MQKLASDGFERHHQQFYNTTQSRIWESVGEDYGKFGDRVGWRLYGSAQDWRQYSELILASVSDRLFPKQWLSAVSLQNVESQSNTHWDHAESKNQVRSRGDRYPNLAARTRNLQSEQQCDELLDTHPMFTGRCPSV